MFQSLTSISVSLTALAFQHIFIYYRWFLPSLFPFTSSLSSVLHPTLCSPLYTVLHHTLLCPPPSLCPPSYTLHYILPSVFNPTLLYIILFSVLHPTLHPPPFPSSSTLPSVLHPTLSSIPHSVLHPLINLQHLSQTSDKFQLTVCTEQLFQVLFFANIGKISEKESTGLGVK